MCREQAAPITASRARYLAGGTLPREPAAWGARCPKAPGHRWLRARKAFRARLVSKNYAHVDYSPVRWSGKPLLTGSTKNRGLDWRQGALSAWDLAFDASTRQGETRIANSVMTTVSGFEEQESRTILSYARVQRCPFCATRVPDFWPTTILGGRSCRANSANFAAYNIGNKCFRGCDSCVIWTEQDYNPRFFAGTGGAALDTLETAFRFRAGP